MKKRILLVDDDRATCDSFGRYLGDAGYTVDTAASIHDGTALLKKGRYDVLLADMRLPDGNGIEWIPRVRGTWPDMTIMVITGVGGVETAMEAMRAGADNYLVKPVNMENLEILIQKGLELEGLRKNEATRRRLHKDVEPYFGNDPASRALMKLAGLAARNEATVLLQGETGSGKGMVARWIHGHSARGGHAFVEVNCSTLKGDLLRSELFGHVKGAFTSAVGDREGLVELADGGTLFLDEIGDMDADVQAQFLKAIEERTYRRVGDVQERTSDFRLICATNRPLASAVERGAFREDLYYRINVFPVLVPSLRELDNTLYELAERLLDGMHAPVSVMREPVRRLLASYGWPGNIRELRNMLERALLLADGVELAPEHFPGIVNDAEHPGPEKNSWKLDDAVKKHLVNTMRHYNDDTALASEALGISRVTLYRKLKKYGISLP